MMRRLTPSPVAAAITVAVNVDMDVFLQMARHDYERQQAVQAQSRGRNFGSEIRASTF
ncbi:hypothetical protein [Actinomadura sp. KC216]|uniref:hypothetical protein n=1 Tax=Actinomadura sp. KC216 TaxID=2530370 RepID=UPI0014051E7A|nr:hypothetical protein [Actinomadura sp. KC216]